jgi:hypothetical protein
MVEGPSGSLELCEEFLIGEKINSECGMRRRRQGYGAQGSVELANFGNPETKARKAPANKGFFGAFLCKKLSDTSDTSDSRGLGFVVGLTR